jgi:hypothetical protein
MLIFSVSFQFFRMHPRREQLTIDLNLALGQNFEFCLGRGSLVSPREVIDEWSTSGRSKSEI